MTHDNKNQGLNNSKNQEKEQRTSMKGNYQLAKAIVLDKMEMELPEELTYHSTGHTKDVLKATIRLAESENVNGNDLHLLKTAALYHDSGFLFGLNDHEELSCDFARNVLPELEYSNAQINSICEMIIATEIPQNPKNHLEKILCDADLDYLGRDDFWEISELLFQEFKFLKVVQNETEWNKLQIRFFESHQYFTETAKAWRAEKKAEHLDKIRKKV